MLEVTRYNFEWYEVIFIFITWKKKNKYAYKWEPNFKTHKVESRGSRDYAYIGSDYTLYITHSQPGKPLTSGPKSLPLLSYL